MNARSLGLLFDMTRCGGCRKCVKACMQSHDFQGDPDRVRELSATAYTAMVEDGDHFVRKLCRHCLEPSCASVCPVAALRKTDLGPVTYDSSRCIGCRYCMVACPFSVPRYEWHNAVPAVRKCDLCADRLGQGKVTACAEACPNEATTIGTREELLAEARRRIAETPEDYYDHIYGEKEMGGTSVLFIGPKPVDAFGFTQAMGETPMPLLTWRVLQMIPSVVVLGGATLGAIWWITRRRDEVARAEALEARAALAPPQSPAGEEV